MTNSLQNYWKIPLLFLFAFILKASSLYGQIEVEPAITEPFTPESLIRNVFLGDGIQITNIQFNGEPRALGYFNNGMGDIGFHDGLLLTTGEAFQADKPNVNAGFGGENQSTAISIELESIAESTLHDVLEYVITFIPTTDSIEFKYRFASEEYPEFGYDCFHDVFGFYIFGDGFPLTGENIAIVPGTNLPVSVKTIHPADPDPTNGVACPPQPPGMPENEHLYIDNAGSPNLEYDGFTQTFFARAKVNPCQEYTLKLAIADVHDPLYDSAVFLESRSFSSSNFEADLSGIGLDGSIVEGCSSADLVFSIPSPRNEDYQINFAKIGTATAGQDYQDFPNLVTIPAGDLSTSISIEALGDQTVESGDSIGIEIAISACFFDTIWIPIKDAQLLLPELGNDLNICAGDSVQLQGAIGNPADTIIPFEILGINETILEVQEDRSNPINSIPSFFEIDVSDVAPAEIVPGLIHSICVNINHPIVGELDIFLQAPSGKFIELSTDNGGLDNHYINTCFTVNAETNIKDGIAPFTGNFLPEGNLASFYGEKVNGTWRLIVRDDDGIGGTNPKGTMLNWSINFNKDYQVHYQWEQADSLSCIDCPNPFVNPTENTQYTLTATDSYGCTATDDITVNVQQGLAAPVSSCLNVTESTVTIGWEEVDGAQDYSVNINEGGWESSNQGNFEHLITGLAEGDSVAVQIRANSSAGCPAIAEMVTCITAACAVPIAQIDSALNVGCKGGIDGQLFLSAASDAFFVLGTDTSQLGQTARFQTLGANTYKIYILADTQGCADSMEVTITEPIEELDLRVVSTQQLSCFQSNDGAISIATSGGTSPYTYTWFDSQGEIIPAPNVFNLENLPADQYQILLRDTNNCQEQKFIEILEPEPIIIDSTSVGKSCFDIDDGMASVEVNPNYNNLTFIWDNNERTAAINNLGVGAYTVSVRTDEGCEETRRLVIDTAPAIEIREESTTTASCEGKNDGSATVLAEGGIGDFTYAWNDPMNQTDATANQLTANDYEVTATDATGCQQTLNVTIDALAGIELDTVIQAISCFDANDGQIELSIIGGTPNYSISWSDNQAINQENRADLAAGNYRVTVTDGNNCFSELDFNIGDKAPINLVATQDSASCSVDDGSIAIGIIDGGSGSTNYTFQWADDPNRNTARAEKLGSGDYSVTVIDDNGCMATENIFLGEKEGIQLTFSTTPVLCPDERTGTASIVATGGSGNYLYIWDDPAAQETPMADNLSAGEYMILVLDNNGCEKSLSVNVPDNSIPIAVNFDKQDISCFGRTDGQISVNVENNPANLSYQWSSGETTANLSNKTANNYYLTITDANGCEHQDSTEIIEPSEFFAETMVEPISCPGTGDGVLNIIPMGGTAPYQFSLDGNRYAPSGEFDRLLPGQYTPSVRDANNCSVPLSEFELAEALPLNIILENIKIKSGEPTQLSPEIQNGSGQFTFLWTGNNLTDLSCTDCESPLLNPTNSQLYKLKVIDESGCEADANIRVLVEKNRKIYVPTGFSPNSDGNNDRLTVHGVEGTEILSFKIFDRWGELVFTNGGFIANDFSSGWDGHFKGKPLTSSVFAWIVEARFSDGAVEMVKGHSTLVR